MKLHWIRTFDKVEHNLLQETFSEPFQGYVYRGRLLRFCKGCKRWVLDSDYRSYCSQGYHEFSEEIALPEKLS